MEIVKLREDHFVPLFLYWNKLAWTVPYFFPVSLEKWRQCLLDDTLGGETLFPEQETFIALEQGQVVGFCQCGQPAFAWDGQGQKFYNPQIGILRHFYFDESRRDAADLLFQCSARYLDQFPVQHAFYHIFGMSCNARHGKLHQSLAHVDRFLCARGFRVEHENVCYSLELEERAPKQERQLELVPQVSLEPETADYEICLSHRPIGSLQIRYLADLTGGVTTDIAYLTWIEIAAASQGQGLGARSMELLISFLRSRQIRQLHLDTAATNSIAQRFYERFGFEDRGRSRGYRKA